MKEKLITIVVLPYSKALLLKVELEAKEIECDLENFHLIEGAVSSTVRVKIIDKEIKRAIPILEEFLGVKPLFENPRVDKNEQHILVPVDFSSNSKKACLMAFNIASHLGIKIVFIHSYFNPINQLIPYGDIYAYDSSLLSNIEKAEETANEKFQQFVNTMSTEIGKENWNSVSPEYIIKSGHAENDILAFAHKHHSQLIVMGSGNNMNTTATVGSVTADIIYNARVPVLVVPGNTPDQELKDFSTILYATNFDDKDFYVLEKLMALLYPFNIKIICAHVGQQSENKWDKARLNGMKNILKEKYRSEDFECKLIIGNNILESIDQIIEDEKIDILSLTTHKRNMISRLFNPSLAKKMVFHTNTPLLVFHA